MNFISSALSSNSSAARPNGNYAEIQDRCRECAEIILENIRNDQRAEDAEKTLYRDRLGASETIRRFPMPTLKRDAPYIWVTWITKLLVGKECCLWAAWFKSHYKDYAKAPSDFDALSWNIKHTVLLDTIATQYAHRFDRVQREHQNSFNYHGSSGAILSGKPDLIGITGNEMRICDAKTGQKQDEHWAQMMLYMYFYPRCFPQAFKDMNIVGELCYGDGTKQEVYMDEFDDTFRGQVMKVLQALSSTEPPPTVPSSTECGYCHITNVDCLDRLEAAPLSTQVELGEF